ncbi:uncharacterized protein LOC144575865 [Carex rostrata]
MAEESGSRVSWTGLLRWSLSHIDGTRPSPHINEEKMSWFEEAMEAQATVGMAPRMRDMTLLLLTSPSHLEDLLDELHEHVESIDIANDLISVGGLFPLLNYLRNGNARIRAKAAQVITTVVQNNPISQQSVMEASGFEPLFWNFMFDPDLTARIKALGAISSLIRNNKPGVAAFCLANGYAGLKDALSSDSTRFQRKALNLTLYLLTERNSDSGVVTELGFPRMMIHLASSPDSGVREAALGSLLELARDSNLLTPTEGARLRSILQRRIDSIRVMSIEDLCAALEERRLVESLWLACYNEPSLLHEEGLVVLPGEDLFELPPDVGSRFSESLPNVSDGDGESSNAGDTSSKTKTCCLLGM